MNMIKPKRIDLKESLFGSAIEVGTINKCNHLIWYFGEEFDVRLFGYLKVDGICLRCETYSNEDREDTSYRLRNSPYYS